MRTRPAKPSRNLLFQRVIFCALLSILFGCGQSASMVVAKLPPMKEQKSSQASKAEGSGTQNAESI